MLEWQLRQAAKEDGTMRDLGNDYVSVAGSATARSRAEQRWHTFQRDHLPHLKRCPDTGYLTAA